jgi:hypothetical protein
VSRGTGIGDTRVNVENIRNKKSAKMRDTRVRCRSEETKQRVQGQVKWLNYKWKEA